MVCGLSLRSAALESLPGPRGQSLFQRDTHGLVWPAPNLRLRSGPRRPEGPVKAHRGPICPMMAQLHWTTEGCS